MLTPREATEAPTQGSRSPLSTTEVTELATVRLFLILSALLCSLRPGFCIVCDFAHARPIMLQHSTSYYAQCARRGGGRRPGNEAIETHVRTSVRRRRPAHHNSIVTAHAREG